MHQFYLGKFVFDMDGNIYEDKTTGKYSTTNGRGANYCKLVVRGDDYYIYELFNSVPDPSKNETMEAKANLDVYDRDLNLIYTADDVDYDSDINGITEEEDDNVIN